MYKLFLGTITFFCFLSCANKKTCQGDDHYGTKPDISEEDLRYHISVLASDSLEGRKAGTSGEAKAGEYIRRTFARLALSTYSENYYYPFAYLHNKKHDCTLEIDVIEAVYERDFTLLLPVDEANVSATVVFVGNGYLKLKAPVVFDTYKEDEVKDKWVMFIEDNPSRDKSEVMPGVIERCDEAKKAGAAGILAVDFDKSSGGELVSHEYRYYSGYSLPVLRISRKMADRLLEYAGTSMAEMLDTLHHTRNVRVGIPVSVNASIHVKNDSIRSNNMIAYLEGKDPVLKNEYIVVGAHYDHLGKQTITTETGEKEIIYNGADDNASGTAGLLELAEKVVADDNLRRSIIFMAFGAEEDGLQGSKHICKNLPVPASDIRLMINLDMIGRLDSGRLSVGTVISRIKSVENLLKEISLSHPGLALEFSCNTGGRSDHFSFYAENIPAIMLTTGIHKEYHTPDDTTGIINYQGEKAILDLVYDLIVARAEKADLK